MSQAQLVELDELDRAILRVLVSNCNVSVRSVARSLNKSPTLVLKRLQRLHQLGVVERCEAVLNYKRLGYTVMALIMLNVEGPHIEEVERMLAAEPNVRAVYDITGEYDVAVIALFRDVSELDSFIKRILKSPFIKRSTTSVIFKAVKDERNIDAFGCRSLKEPHDDCGGL